MDDSPSTSDPVNATRDPSSPRWVGIDAVAWVLDYAPVPNELGYTLLAIARHADQDGRGARPSAATIAEKVGKSAPRVRDDIKKLRKLGLLLLGDQTLTAHLPAGQRPVVYDLPLKLRGPKPMKASRNKSGLPTEPIDDGDMSDTPTSGGIPAETPTSGGRGTSGGWSAPTSEGGSTPTSEGMGTPTSGGSQTTMNNHGKNHDEESSSSSRRASALSALTGADDDDDEEKFDEQKTKTPDDWTPAQRSALTTIADKVPEASPDEAEAIVRLILAGPGANRLVSFVALAKASELRVWLNRVRAAEAETAPARAGLRLVANPNDTATAA